MTVSKDGFKQDVLSSIKSDDARAQFSFDDRSFVALGPRVTLDAEVHVDVIAREMCDAGGDCVPRYEYERLVSAYSNFLEASYVVRKLFDPPMSKKRPRADDDEN